MKLWSRFAVKVEVNRLDKADELATRDALLTADSERDMQQPTSQHCTFDAIHFCFMVTTAAP